MTQRLLAVVLYAATWVCAIDQAPAQEAPLRVRFLRREPARLPLPPRVHLRLELSNDHDEPRWLLTPFSQAARLPVDGRFRTDPEDGFPFFVLKAQVAGKDDSVTLLGFLGEPRVSAFLLPGHAKITLEDFELPTNEEISELDWAEAASLKVEGKRGSESFTLAMQKWLKTPLVASPKARLAADPGWKDLVRDAETGELLPDVPKDAVTALSAEITRSGRVTVEGYAAPVRYYHAAEAPATPTKISWRPESRFRAVRSFKVEDLAFAPDSKMLAVSLQGFKVVGLDLAKRQERVFPTTDAARARFFAFSPDGHLLVKQSTPDGLTAVVDWNTGKEVDLLRYASNKTLAGADHVPAPGGGRMMVSVGRSLQLWDSSRFEAVARLQRPEEERPFLYRCGCFSGDGRRFAASFESDTEGGRVYVWNLPNVAGNADVGLDPVAQFANRQTAAHHLAFSHDGKVLAGAGRQTTSASIWHVDAKETGALQAESFRTFEALALSPDGKTLAVASSPLFGDTRPARLEVRGTATTHRRDPMGGVVVHAPGAGDEWKAPELLEGLSSPIHAVTFSADGRRLAGGDHLGTVQIWQRP